MGRNKGQGPKQLANVINKPPRKIQITARGKSGVLVVSDVIAAGLAARGYQVDDRE